jgi:hypothetical protein
MNRSLTVVFNDPRTTRVQRFEINDTYVKMCVKNLIEKMLAYSIALPFETQNLIEKTAKTG